MASIIENRTAYPDALSLPFAPFYGADYNKTRRMKSIILSNVLMKSVEFKVLNYFTQIDIITHIENSCANETIRKSRGYNLRCDWDSQQFINIYHSVCFNILSVLDEENNTLVGKILSGEININTIAGMSCKELVPEIYETLTYHINKRISTETSQKYTEMYHCGKCKKNKCTAERVQNRSGDEGSSFFITCLFCGQKWFK